MGCIFAREVSSGAVSESAGKNRDLSVESTRKVDDGRYCLPDPEQDFSSGYEGKDMILQNLRQLYVYKVPTIEAVKGKHFFLESDIKGPHLKLDNTGKAILTVLRHLGRISETRIGHNRVIILLKPQ